MVSAILKAYDTWLTRPNQDRISVRFRGVEKSAMALMYFFPWTHCVLGYFKACEFNFIFGEVKFGGVERDSMFAAGVEPLSCLEEALLDCVGP